MIATLSGKVEELGLDYAVIDVGGVGFQVFIPTSTISNIGSIGSEAKLHIHLYVREDTLTLYGFATSQELILFKILINVSGLGPKLALAMLSAMSVEQLSMALAAGSSELLTSIPGIGKKMAHRIILELKDKIAAGLVTSAEALPSAGSAEVIAALTSLGYSTSEAARAVASLSLETADLPLEEKVKQALGYFGGK
jgi:holliday junction DNA helicase RuvA